MIQQTEGPGYSRMSGLQRKIREICETEPRMSKGYFRRPQLVYDKRNHLGFCRHPKVIFYRLTYSAHTSFDLWNHFDFSKAATSSVLTHLVTMARDQLSPAQLKEMHRTIQVLSPNPILEMIFRFFLFPKVSAPAYFGLGNRTFGNKGDFKKFLDKEGIFLFAFVRHPFDR